MILNFSSYKDGLPSPKTITMLLTTLAKWLEGAGSLAPKHESASPQHEFSLDHLMCCKNFVLLVISRHCRELRACSMWLKRVHVPADASLNWLLIFFNLVLNWPISIQIECPGRYWNPSISFHFLVEIMQIPPKSAREGQAGKKIQQKQEQILSRHMRASHVLGFHWHISSCLTETKTAT